MTEEKSVQLSDKTSVGLPLRNLIGLATAVAVDTLAKSELSKRGFILKEKK